MALSDLAVYSEFAYKTMTEVQAQQIELFNAATKGGLQLASAANMGHYNEMITWAKISGLVKRRNALGSGSVSSKILTQKTDVSVKVAAGTPPIEIDQGMFKWIQQDPEVAGFVLGRQLAGDSMADMVNTALLAFVSAVSAQSSLVHDGTAAVLSLAALSKGAAKFGDRNGAIACWVMHSKPAFDIYGAALAGTSNLFNFGNVNVMSDGFGRPFILTDADPLVTDGTPDVYHTLGLVAGGVQVEQNNDFIENTETKNGGENITRTYQAEWSFNVKVKGYAWNKVNGGPSPTNAAIGTSTNWDKFATSDKDTAGVIVNSQ